MPTLDRGHVYYLGFSLNGANAAPDLIEALLECSVDNSIHLPDTCTIRLRDEQFVLIDDARLQIGTAVVVQAGYQGKPDLTPIFWGEITGAELDLAAHGLPTITLRCFDRSHRLHRGRYSRPFVQSTDADIFSKVAREAGFTPHARATSPVHDWVFQNNQTNWEFLCERAAHNGYRLFIKGERDLYFEPVKEEGDSVIALTWGDDLRSFRPRVSASPQVESVQVRGWDPKTKAAIVADYAKPSSGPQIQNGAKGGAVAAASFGSAKMVVVDKPVHSQAEAQALARSVCDDIAGSFVEADGLCFGEPSLMPGVGVEIRNIGQRFSGKYFVTATNHVYTPTEGYSTTFSVSGKRPSTLLSLLEDSPTKRASLGGNIVIGIVTDNRDSENLGRVKVKYPWLSDEHQSYWARVVSQMAGGGRGMFNLPEINDEVLVAFEHGDIRRPYVMGQLWNGKDRPPSLSGNGELGGSSEVNRRGFYSRIGHQLNFDDTGGQGDITLKTAGGHIVTLDDAGKKIQLSTTGGHVVIMDDDGKKIQLSTTGGHLILMDDPGKNIIAKTTGGHLIDLDDAGSQITLTNAPGDKITMKDSGVINIQANQEINLTAPMINVDAQLKLNLSGQLMVDISSPLAVAMKGSVAVDISGAMVKVNS